MTKGAQFLEYFFRKTPFKQTREYKISQVNYSEAVHKFLSMILRGTFPTQDGGFIDLNL